MITIFWLLLTTIIKFFLQIYLWKDSLAIVDNFDLSFKNIIKTHFIGLALRFFLPGGHATFGKIFYVNEEKRKQAFYAIIIEKFFTVWIILFFASWAVMFLYKKWIIFAMLLAIILIFCPFIMPIIFRRYIKYEVFDRCYTFIPRIYLVQIVFVLLTFFQYSIIINTFLENGVNLFDLSLIISIVLVANVIPITFNGLGLREIASVMFMPSIGISAELAVSSSLIIFIFNSVLPAFPGLIYMIGKDKNV
jgi:uncharacterized membrane protein YbhN (UPF0104 family)